MPLRLLRRPRGDRLAAQEHPAAGRPVDPVDAGRDLRDARTDQPVQADDLARPHLDVDVVELARPAEPVEDQHRLAVGDLPVRPLVGEDPADHQLRDAPDVEVADRVGADGLAVAHDGDLVGDPEQLVEPVRDVDDRDTRPR